MHPNVAREAVAGVRGAIIGVVVPRLVEILLGP